jgi:hypothetical protein
LIREYRDFKVEVLLPVFQGNENTDLKTPQAFCPAFMSMTLDTLLWGYAIFYPKSDRRFGVS